MAILRRCDAARGADLDRRGIPGCRGHVRAPRLAGADRASASAQTIRTELGLTASVGVASTRLVAKIASDLRKPDGLVVVPDGTEADFLAPLPDRAAVGRRASRPGARSPTTACGTIGDLARPAARRAVASVRGAWVDACRARTRHRPDSRRGRRRRPVGQPRAHVRSGHA